MSQQRQISGSQGFILKRSSFSPEWGRQEAEVRPISFRASWLAGRHGIAHITRSGFSNAMSAPVVLEPPIFSRRGAITTAPGDCRARRALAWCRRIGDRSFCFSRAARAGSSRPSAHARHHWPRRQARGAKKAGDGSRSLPRYRGRGASLLGQQAACAKASRPKYRYQLTPKCRVDSTMRCFSASQYEQ